MYRNLNAECARAHITKHELALNALGITPTTLSLKLKKKDGLKLCEAKAIQNYLKTDLTIDELFEYEED